MDGGVLPRLCRWAQELLADGLCDRVGFDTYEREIERYGGLAGMAAAERIFAVDSATVVELVDLARRTRIRLDRTAPAVLSIDALLAALGLNEASRLGRYRRAVSSRHEAGADDLHRRRAMRSLVATRGCQSFVHMHCNRLLSRPAPTEQHVLGLALRAREGLECAPLLRRQ